jgi:hypothetical protein
MNGTLNSLVSRASLCGVVGIRRAPRLALADGPAPAGAKKGKGKGKKKKRKGKKQASKPTESGGVAPAPQALAAALPEEPAGGACDDEDTAAQEEEVEGVAEDAGECPICLTGLEGAGAEDEVVLECNHRFHDDCIELWVSKCSQKRVAAACPYCRGPLRKKA